MSVFASLNLTKVQNMNITENYPKGRAKMAYDRLLCPVILPERTEPMGYEKAKEFANKLEFGDILFNHWAGEKNPNRIGVFIGLNNRSITLTNMQGKKWSFYVDKELNLSLIGSIFHFNWNSEPCGEIHSTDWGGKCFKCGKQIFVREPSL